MPTPDHSPKFILIEILDYLKYKLLNDDCTPEEIRSFANMAEDNLHINTTTAHIAERYHQSRSNVRNVLSRKTMPKAKWVKLYDYMKFMKNMPKRWKTPQQIEDEGKPSLEYETTYNNPK